MPSFPIPTPTPFWGKRRVWFCFFSFFFIHFWTLKKGSYRSLETAGRSFWRQRTQTKSIALYKWRKSAERLCIWSREDSSGLHRETGHVYLSDIVCVKWIRTTPNKNTIFQIWFKHAPGPFSILHVEKKKRKQNSLSEIMAAVFYSKQSACHRRTKGQPCSVCVWRPCGVCAFHSQTIRVLTFWKGEHCCPLWAKCQHTTLE